MAPPHHPPADTSPLGAPPRGPRVVRVVRWATLAALAVVVAVLLGGRHRLPGREELETTLAPLGPAAAPLFAVGYGAASAVGVPVTALIATAVWLFGLGEGFGVAMAGGLLGAAGGYWLARFLGRDWVLRRLESRRRLHRLYREIEDYGAVVVLLLRALPSPLPFALINYLLGVTGIRFGRYLVASAVGMVPSVGVYAYAAAQLVAPLTGEGRVWHRPGFWVAVVLLVLMTVAIPLLVRHLDRRTHGRLLDRLAERLVPRRWR